MSDTPISGDGVIPHGVPFDITILEDGALFSADAINLDFNSTRLKSKSPRGRNSRNRVILDDTTFGGDFQLADEDQDPPIPGQTFLADADRDGNNEPYQIEKSGIALMQDGEWKSKVSGFAMVNPLPYVTTVGKTSGALAFVTGGAITSVQFAAALPRGVTLTPTSFVGVDLPPGLSISTAGALSGTPTLVGDYYADIKVTGTRIVKKKTETLTGVRTIKITVTAP